MPLLLAKHGPSFGLCVCVCVLRGFGFCVVAFPATMCAHNSFNSVTLFVSHNYIFVLCLNKHMGDIQVR